MTTHPAHRAPPDLTKPETVEEVVKCSANLVERLRKVMPPSYFMVAPGKVIPYGTIFHVDKGMLVLPAVTGGATYHGNDVMELSKGIAGLRQILSGRLDIPPAHLDVMLWAPHFAGFAQGVVNEVEFGRFLASVEKRMASFRKTEGRVLDRFKAIARSMRTSAAPASNSAPTTSGGIPAASEVTEATHARAVGARVGELRVLRTDGTGIDSRYDRLLRPLALVRSAKGPDEVWETLSREFPWMAQANLAISRAVALSERGEAKSFRMTPILLAGKPGIGKSRYARRVGEILGLPLAPVSMSGLNSSMAIRGSEKGWLNARPSLPVGVFAAHGTANPLILLDEVDKAGSGDTNGNPLDALLSLLERETAETYRDEFLLLDVDCSRISWMLTANDVNGLPSPLLSRVRVIHCESPQIEHFSIALAGMLSDLARELSIPVRELETIVDLDRLRNEFARRLDMRSMQQTLVDLATAAIWSPPGMPVAEGQETKVVRFVPREER